MCACGEVCATLICTQRHSPGNIDNTDSGGAGVCDEVCVQCACVVRCACNVRVW